MTSCGSPRTGPGANIFEVMPWADEGSDGWRVTVTCAVVPDADAARRDPSQCCRDQ